MKKAVSLVFNILTVPLILIAVSVSALIFATGNRYSEPVFGDTMLLAVGESDSIGDIVPGSLAIVDLAPKNEGGGYYAAFLGNGTRITRDPTASIGTVRVCIPYLGGVMDFFRNPLGFLLVIILPLTAIFAWHITHILLIMKSGGGKKRVNFHVGESQTEATPIGVSAPKGGG